MEIGNIGWGSLFLIPFRLDSDRIIQKSKHFKIQISDIASSDLLIQPITRKGEMIFEKSKLPPTVHSLFSPHFAQSHRVNSPYSFLVVYLPSRILLLTSLDWSSSIGWTKKIDRMDEETENDE